MTKVATKAHLHFKVFRPPPPPHGLGVLGKPPVWVDCFSHPALFCLVTEISHYTRAAQLPSSSFKQRVVVAVRDTMEKGRCSGNTVSHSSLIHDKQAEQEVLTNDYAAPPVPAHHIPPTQPVLMPCFVKAAVSSPLTPSPSITHLQK
ncbi:hypothetical protein E2C01_005651 [Portunus trituberculatus]|uniref:Uncharacterized protein n=1 Tax=Portunus trituberculatus TaxID=210409 RepID=A0A5B7CW24_PORTR|nr:hypothetical protein [Portunus trituberculatus]